MGHQDRCGVYLGVGAHSRCGFLGVSHRALSKHQVCPRPSTPRCCPSACSLKPSFPKGPLSYSQGPQQVRVLLTPGLGPSCSPHSPPPPPAEFLISDTTFSREPPWTTSGPRPLTSLPAGSQLGQRVLVQPGDSCLADAWEHVGVGVTYTSSCRLQWSPPLPQLTNAASRARRRMA